MSERGLRLINSELLGRCLAARRREVEDLRDPHGHEANDFSRNLGRGRGAQSPAAPDLDAVLHMCVVECGTGSNLIQGAAHNCKQAVLCDASGPPVSTGPPPLSCRRRACAASGT